MDKEKAVNILDKSMEYLLYFMIFFIPISKAAIESIFGLAMAVFFFKHVLKPEFGFLKNITFIFLLLFFTFLALSLFNSGPYLAKGLKALFFKWFEYIFIFIMAASAFKRPKGLRRAGAVFIISASLIAVDSIFQQVRGVDFLRLRPLLGGVVTASFENPNALSAFLVPLLLLFFGFLFTSAKKINYKLIAAILVIVLMVSLVLTGSRGGWMGFIFGVILIVVLTRKFNFFIPVVCLFLMLLVSLPASRVRVAQVFRAGGSSERFNLAHSALDMVRDNPFLGKGLGTFMDYFRQYNHTLEGVYYAHNSYLQMAAEAGVFTLLWFLLFCGSVLYKAIISFMQTRSGLLAGLICALCGFMIHAFFDNHLYSLQLAVLFWFLLGLTFAASRVEIDKGQSP